MRNSRDLRALRREYLFALANLCHLPPHLSDELDIDDWEVLTREIDHYIKTASNANAQLARQLQEV